MILLHLVLLTAAAQLGAGQPSPPHIVLPGMGTAVGRYANGAREYLGLPYAAPPVGVQGRWRPPMPASSWAPAVYDATYYRPSCQQDREFTPVLGPLSEDCLYLNVFTPPTATPESRLPVLVWFHGGGYKNGGANESRLNGSYDAVFPLPGAGDNQGRIIVTSNYRLNVFGFLGSDLLRQLSDDNSTGNYGLQDQRAVLAWVSKYIAVFGGDPQRVTIFGESAGGGSVSNHLVTRRSWPYFSQAIAESGAFTDWVSNSMASTEQTFAAVVSRLNCSGAAAAASDAGPTASPVINCLLQADVQDLVKVQTNPFDGYAGWAPTVDGVEMADYPARLLAAGQAKKVPVIVGSVRDEGASFIGPTPHAPNATTREDFRTFLAAKYNLSSSSVDQLEYLYNGSSSAYQNTSCCTAWWWAASRAVGDQKMACGALRAAANYTALGVQQAFVYVFDHYPTAGGNEFAYHSVEIAYVFHVDELLDGAVGIRVADMTADYWLRFAAGGDPNFGRTGGSLPTWPKFGSNQQYTMQIDTVPNVAINLKRLQCDFWANHRYFP